MKTPLGCARVLAATIVVSGVGMLWLPEAAADVDGDAAVVDQGGAPIPGAAVQATTVTSSNADPAAVAACAKFAQALDNASDGYGNYADSLDDRDGTVNDSNVAGRTSLRQSASFAMDAANTPGLTPEIADPMRAWSLGAAKLIVKMGLNLTGTLDSTATEVNNNAEAVQRACAAAGTHA